MAAAFPDSYDFTQSFTWSAYIKLFEPAATGDEAGSGIFGRAPADSEHNPGSKILYVNGQTLGFDTGWVGAINASDPEIELDTWTHVAITHDVDLEAISIYMDGEAVLEEGEPVIEFEFPLDEFPEDEEFNGGMVNTGFRIGDGAIGFFADPFPGLIDNVAIWSVALNEDEIAALADGATPLPPIIDTPQISIANDWGQIQIEFTGTLQRVGSLGETWEDVPGATSPFSVSVDDADSAFFRAR